MDNKSDLLDPASINPLNLPSVALIDRRSLPELPCIYFAVDAQDQIQYIGRSSNLYRRWLNHHREYGLQKCGDVRIAWLEVSDVSLLPTIESALIEWFAPPLNGMAVEKRLGQPATVVKVGRTKRPYQFMLTKYASNKIDEAAKEMGLSRSEVLERCIRSGVMLEGIKKYKAERAAREANKNDAPVTAKNLRRRVGNRTW